MGLPTPQWGMSSGLVVWTAVGVFNLVAALQATGVSRAIYARRKK
jgi:hypothetical protein